MTINRLTLEIATTYTKHFIKEAKTLKEQGIVKNFAEIADTLDWSRTSMSSVMNGTRSVPLAIYRKFTEMYKITPVHENGVESAKNDYTDKYIALLEKQANLHGLEEKLEAVLAYQKTFFHVAARILSKIEKMPLSSAYNDMDKQLLKFLKEAPPKDKIDT